MVGLLGYGIHVPVHRLDRAAIRAALGAGGGRGTRSVAGHDEDTTSMAVEAARAAVAVTGIPDDLAAVVFSTTAPAYLDKTNAAVVHAALGLAPEVGAYDAVGAVRSATGALRQALRSQGSTLVVASDVRTGRPGSADETNGGDAAVALVVGDGPGVIAELVGIGTASDEFTDRWRRPGDGFSVVWEERFGEGQYVPLATGAANDALKSAGLALGEIDHVVVTGVHPRALKRVRAQLCGEASTPVVDLDATVGDSGVAAAWLGLAEVLDRAESGQHVLVVSLADGADALVLRTTDALVDRRPQRSVVASVAAGRAPMPYDTFLTWRGFLHREPPRRPEPEGAAAPPASRNEAWKFGFVGAACTECGTVHLPPRRVCIECGAVDHTTPRPLADTPATIATFTIDHLAFSENPPIMAAVVDFDGGGRFQCELTDCSPDEVEIGVRLEMTFRRLYTAPNGVHNYFWKARPTRSEGST